MSQEPSYISSLWQRWKVLGKKIGDFQARVIFSLFYFLLLPPLAVILRLSSDPLHRHVEGNSFWIERLPETKTGLEGARRQF